MADNYSVALSGNKPLEGTTVLGKYELLQELAIGGMATLYIARARGLADFSKPVALKRILPQYAADRNFVEMFLDEARLAATLHHPNVVQVYDIGQLGGDFFFTMEYVHGESLAHVMQRLADQGRRLPLEHAVQIGIGVAAGLDYAHQKADDSGNPMHIVHRDIAPSNILLSYNGNVKLADFGIAKANTRHHSTEVGTLKGRVAYMSPEQSIGAEIDARSDLFSLGVVLYEIVTGRRMYGGANQLAILHRLQNFSIEPPSARSPECPPALEAIIMRALAPKVEDRYQSAADFQYDLETFAHTGGLFLSSVRMSKFMRVLFGDRPEPWKEDTIATQIQTTGRAELLDELEESKPHRVAGSTDTGAAELSEELEELGPERSRSFLFIGVAAALLLAGVGFAVTQLGLKRTLAAPAAETSAGAPAAPTKPTVAPTEPTDEPAKEPAAEEPGEPAAGLAEPAQPVATSATEPGPSSDEGSREAKDVAPPAKSKAPPSTAKVTKPTVIKPAAKPADKTTKTEAKPATKPESKPEGKYDDVWTLPDE